MVVIFVRVGKATFVACAWCSHNMHMLAIVVSLN